MTREPRETVSPEGEEGSSPWGWLMFAVVAAVLVIGACQDGKNKPGAAKTPAPPPASTGAAANLPAPPPGAVVVPHWANGHMMSDALLPAFARDFNAAGHRTASGKPIHVQPLTVNSAVIMEELISRVRTGAPAGASNSAVGGDAANLPHPTIVTPAADHWLGQVNHALGRTAIDLGATQAIARTWIGIVASPEMARCLGWPDREVGFGDVLALRQDPRGWTACPTARPEWGKTPLVSFTDPSSSSTARSVLYTLYAIAAGKPVEQLTPADVARPEVVEYVRRFQSGVDHYVPDTLVLNSKIFGGPSYGHLFFIGEDNLVKLYQGKVKVTDTTGTKARPLERDMVMIYPKEGATSHNHSAAIVRAPWVTPEQAEAAQRWIAYLRDEARQQAFMEEGFRPATAIPLGPTLTRQFGLDPLQPATVSNTDRIDPATAEAIVRAWDDVKKPGVVTFVVDVSGSMAGAKLQQAKEGVLRALDQIHGRNHAGLLSFADGIRDRVAVGPVAAQRPEIVRVVRGLRDGGGTGLYDAIAEGIRMADGAGEGDAIRGVVVLTDGQSNDGRALDALVRLATANGQAGRACSGAACQGLRGTGLAVQTARPVHIFYVGIGGDADMEVGRLLAEATAGAYMRAGEKDLAAILEQFGKYF